MENKTHLKISLIQYPVIWEDAVANHRYLDTLLHQHQTDLIVLPEMFASGFSMDVEKIGEPPFGPTFQWMAKKAKELNAAVAGSVSTYERNRYFNRFYFITPGQAVFIYDKKHLFSYGKEATVYSAGDQLSTIYFKGWKIRPIVCYDLRFPVWCRNTDQYDLLLCNASWPKARRDAWMTLLKARAIENMSFVAGVNRTGEDGYNLIYQGDSKMHNTLGEELVQINDHEEILQFEINKEEQDKTRKHFNFLNDQDEFTLVH